MANPSKKQNFLQGAALLALSNVIVKVIGAVYKLPLSEIIDDVGYSYFNTAYTIYTLMLTIATTGLPIAMSRMISQAYSLGQYNRARQIYKASRNIFLSLGMVCFLIMALFCKQLADAFRQPDAWFAILCLAPCSLLMGFISTYRGFFQGQSNMRPTSVSQVLEAICKLVVGLTLAYLLKEFTGSVALAAGGAILGVTASCLVSSGYIYGKFRPAYREMPVSHEEVEQFQKTVKELLSIAVPITVGSAGLQLLSLVEIRIYMERLETLLSSGQIPEGLVQQLCAEVQAMEDYDPANHYTLMASSMKGTYDFAYTIFNLPSSFIVPINTSVLPAITACLTLKDDNGVRSTEESAARITGLLALPCSIGLIVLAGPVMGLMRGYEGEKLQLATALMAVQGGSTFFYCALMYTNVVLQSHGHAHIPVVNTLLCGVAKLGAVYILTGNGNIHIVGEPISSVLCYFAILVLNLIATSRRIPQKPKLVRNLLKPLLPSVVMGAAVLGCKYVMETFLDISSNLIICAGGILVGVAVYAVLVVLTKGITREDCLLLPKGDKIAKLLKL